MLNIARERRDRGRAGRRCELRHGDIFATGLPTRCADLVVIHQVLHYLSDPAAAVAEAARLVAPGGRLLIVDFAPHAWSTCASSTSTAAWASPTRRWPAGWRPPGCNRKRPPPCRPADAAGLTVKIWSARNPAFEAPAELAQDRISQDAFAERSVA